jgi:hypothetical protein
MSKVFSVINRKTLALKIVVSRKKRNPQIHKFSKLIPTPFLNESFIDIVDVLRS